MKKISVLCVLLCIFLLAGSFPFCVSAKEAQTCVTGNNVYYIETYEQLKNHALIAQADCRYILSDDIVQEDNSNNLEVVISSGAVFNLDLNGYNIQRSTKGNDCALFRIQSDGRMIINDTSVSKTGGCSFSEGYADYNKAVFYNEGGELEILGGYYEIYSPFEQGDCSIVRTTSGYTNIYDGTFDSSSAWGGDTISVGHNAYVYEVPQVVIFGGEFYGKYGNIDVAPFNNYLSNGCLYPSVYVLGGNFYITKDSENSGFCYCNNGWGRVVVAEGSVFYKCLNSRDQMFLEGCSKKLFTQTIDDFKGSYYKVTAPPMILSDSLDYYYRLNGLCDKAVVNSYGESVYEMHKDDFDEILGRIDTIMVSETEKTSPEIHLENPPADLEYVNWYMVNEASYNGESTSWTHIGNAQNVVSWTPDERPEEGANYLIRVVVTKSDLTTYEDIVRLVYAPLKEDEIVDSVEVNGVDVPSAGSNPDFDLTPADDSFYINIVYWTDITDSKNKVILKETDTFQSGHEYMLEVWVRAKEYYKFKTDSDGWLDISAFVGGKEAEVILPGTAISAELLVTYTVEDEVVTSATSTDPAETTESTETTVTEPTETTETTQATDSTVTDPTETTKATEPTATEPTETAKATETTETEPAKTTNTTETIPGTDSSEPIVDKGILGDVDGNGKVNIKDATMIQKAVAKIISLTDAEQIRADVNADAKVNIKDATAIQKYVAKIETGLSIGEPIK